MTDQANGGAPGGAPGGEATGNTTRSFVAARTNQMAERQQSAPGSEPAADTAPQQQQQKQQTAGERMIRVGDADVSEQAITDALAFQAEQNVRKNTLPKSEAEYLAKNSANFQLPEGVKFAFDERDPLLAQARKFALSHGFSQEQFSDLLDLHVASKTGELMNQARLRETNLKQLGAAGPQRIDAVAQWLNAKAGRDGAQVAAFIKTYPSAPIVRAFENVIRAFSNQGGADFSQSHRAPAEDNSGKIPGYSEMSFAQKRAFQMQQQFGDGQRGPSGDRRG